MSVLNYYRFDYDHGIVLLFFFNDTATTEIYTLSLHDALPICPFFSLCILAFYSEDGVVFQRGRFSNDVVFPIRKDRKSTRLNSSHANISYAVFCLKKKKTLFSYIFDPMFTFPLRPYHYQSISL